MVVIRLKRMGRRNRPFFRLVASDRLTKLDGAEIEQLGWYDPLVADPAKKFSIEKERIEHWLKEGAQPSETAKQIFKTLGIKLPEYTVEEKKRRPHKKSQSKRRVKTLARRIR